MFIQILRVNKNTRMLNWRPNEWHNGKRENEKPIERETVLYGIGDQLIEFFQFDGYAKQQSISIYFSNAERLYGIFLCYAPFFRNAFDTLKARLFCCLTIVCIAYSTQHNTQLQITGTRTGFTVHRILLV